jgi:hypothetical protein
MSKNTVNKPLTPNRRRYVVDNDAYAGFARRIVRAYSRRIATGDVDGLTDLVDLSGQIDTAIHQAIHGLRGFGYSWGEIACRLGITRQAAHKRWGGAR